MNREQDGLVVLPHPFDQLRGTGIQPTKEDAKLADCVETFNSRCLRDSYNEKARIYAERHSLHGSAGSDAHFAREIGNASVDISSGNLRKDLLKGNFTILGRKSSLINLGLTEIVKHGGKPYPDELNKIELNKIELNKIELNKIE
jgi:predicted metal-dependent phosphoesterase TrpH